jgi:hypothetical protein
MKPRLLFRALCVGAALLVPVGGLTVLGLGTGTASASTTTISFGSTSKLVFGSLGSANLSGKTATATGSGQWVIGLTVQIPITNATPPAALLVGTKIGFLATHTGTVINTFKTKLVSQIVLKIGTTKCGILTIPAITFNLTSGKWKASATSLSSVTVKTTSCTRHGAIQTEINSGTLTGTVKPTLI